MKRKELDIHAIEEYGAYFPGVFIIKLKKSLGTDMDYESFDEDDWQTFVHEYVHFLQDISTVHGYLYYYFKAQRLSIAVHAISTNKSCDIVLPIQMELTGIKNASGKEILLDLYNKDNDYIRFHHINCIKCESDELSKELITENTDFNGVIESVGIYYNDRSEPYRFGNECIIESMAYLIEHHLFGGNKRINELPYNSCELICGELCPKLLDTPDRIVKLAEISLMYPDSGTVFYHFIKDCEDYNIWDMRDEDFEEYCMRCSDSALKYFDIAYKNALHGIDVLFPMAFKEVQMTNIQLKAYLECGHNYRQSKRLFISDVFKHRDPIEYLKTMINLFDIPMLIDGNGDYYGKPGTQNMPVADAFLSILTERCPEGCCLQTLCEDSGLDCFNKRDCTLSPWKQCESEDLCPVAAYFTGFGISGKRFNWKFN